MRKISPKIEFAVFSDLRIKSADLSFNDIDVTVLEVAERHVEKELLAVQELPQMRLLGVEQEPSQ